ncbi:MAG: hypothetical protein JO259_15835, partial [Mycobacterium sp.]|nr:hypothetical protein [Mycobacterium sp.]
TEAPVDAAAEDWVLDRLYRDEPLPRSPQPHLLDSDRADKPADAAMAGPPPAEAGDVAGVPAGGGSDDEEPAADVNAAAKRSAAWLGVGVAAAAGAIVGGFVMFSGQAHPSSPRPAMSPTPAAAVSAAPRSTALTAVGDQAIPFTASAPGCKGGSTAARSLSDTAGDSAWVCVRGTPDEQADGQVLRIDFRCDAARPQSACSYLVNSVSVTPGWVAKTPGGTDDWLAHRVVSKLQYNFYNGNELAEILTQDTGNVHGPAGTALRHPVLASHVTVIILQTGRPPVSPSPAAGPTSSPGGGAPEPGLVDPGLGAPWAPEVEQTIPPGSLSSPTVSDPVDATFAISAMQFFGHQPN